MDDKPRRRFVRWMLPVVVLVAGGALAVGLIETSPRAKRAAAPRQARLVEVMAVELSTQRTVVPAMGSVRPAREVTLQPRVSGQIVQVSDEFVPGGQFHEGDMLVQIDRTDFELAVRQRDSDVAEARSNLELELGQQTVAKREFEMLGETVAEGDQALVLRQPQLEMVRAKLLAVQAALDQAKLNLDRATVRAPFNAIVRAREANLGMQVTTATTLATLTGTDAYWVEVTVPVDQLQWIEVPGSPARVFNEAAWGAGKDRQGRVVRLLTDLEAEGRMARLLVEVEDPLALEAGNAGQPRLLLGDYVRVEIAGVELESVAALDRKLVRDGHTVWVMTAAGQLEIRPVEIVFRGRQQLFIRNHLKPGEHLVVTDLASPVAGMPLRTRGGEQPR